MHNTIFQRRRVERFAQLLEESTSRRRHSRTELDEELAEYVELGQRVRDAQHPGDATPEADFRTSLRAMLVATAEREGIGRTAEGADETPEAIRPVRGRVVAPGGSLSTPRLRGRRTRGAVIVGLAVGTLALSGMSMASGDALPGDALYPVKRSMENAQAVLTTSELSKGQNYLGYARTRAEEASAERDQGARLDGVLNEMDSQTAQGITLLTQWATAHHDTGALDLIDRWVPDQRARLNLLATGGNADRVQQSLNLINEIMLRSAKLRIALACHAAIGQSDKLGPVPAACPSATGSVGTRRGGTGSSGGSRGSGSGGSNSTGTTGGDPTLAPSPGGNPQIGQSPQASPNHKAGAAVFGLLGGLL